MSDVKKIGAFLKSMKGADYLYLKHCIEIRDVINDIIKKYKVDKKQFCEVVGIPEKEYLDFISGNRNYDVRDMSAINYCFVHFESQILDEKAPIQVRTRYKYSEKQKKPNK